MATIEKLNGRGAEMRFKGLDLNLLIAFDVLCQERNVTRAAERLNMTQSTMSGVLSRLRAHFRDELFVSYGRSMHQTALAAQLQGPLRETVLRIESIVATDGTFDPTTSVRHFKVEFPDHLVPVLLAEISGRLLPFAPNVTVEFSLPRGDPTPLLHRGELDMVVTPKAYQVEEYTSLPLLDDEIVIVGWEENPALHGPLTVDDIMKIPLIKVRFESSRMAGTMTRDEMRLIEGRNNISMIAPTRSSVPSLLVGSMSIAFLHGNLARAAAAYLPLVVRNLPFKSPVVTDIMMYHPTRAEDKGLMWLIDQFVSATRSAATTSAAS